MIEETVFIGISIWVMSKSGDVPSSKSQDGRRSGVTVRFAPAEMIILLSPDSSSTY